MQKPMRMNHTSTSNMQASRLTNQQIFQDLVLLQALLAVLHSNQTGKSYSYYHCYDSTLKNLVYIKAYTHEPICVHKFCK